MSLNEADVENATLSLLGELGYTVDHGPRIAPGETTAERDSFSDVVLVGRLRKAIRQLNPAIPEDAREEALRKVLRVDAASLISNNRAFHRMLRDGVEVEYPSLQRRPAGGEAQSNLSVRLHLVLRVEEDAHDRTLPLLALDACRVAVDLMCRTPRLLVEAARLAHCRELAYVRRVGVHLLAGRSEDCHLAVLRVDTR